MTATTIKARLQRLETIGFRTSHLPPLRIIQRGALTEEQVQFIQAAKAEERLIIIRQIVSPPASPAE